MKLSKDHWLLNRPIAHRGTHNRKAPENTFSAFQKSIDINAPIELDLQILKDGEIVVFHDFTTSRLCGVDKNLIDLNCNEVRELKINNSERIPTFKDTLRFINNQVPLLIEIKNEKVKNPQLHKNILRVIKNYKGDIALQSFNPITVRFFKKHLPNVPIGLLSGSFNDTNLKPIKKFYLKHCLDSFICKPDFISYEWNFLNQSSNRLHNKLRKIPFICWTMRNKNDIVKVPAFCSNYIYDPLVN